MRGNRTDGGARVLVVCRQQPIHRTAAHAVANALQIGDGLRRHPVVHAQADHHPVGFSQRQQLVHELPGRNANMRFGAAFGKCVANAKCDAVPDQQTGYQTATPFERRIDSARQVDSVHRLSRRDEDSANAHLRRRAPHGEAHRRDDRARTAASARAMHRRPVAPRSRRRSIASTHAASGAAPNSAATKQPARRCPGAVAASRPSPRLELEVDERRDARRDRARRSSRWRSRR